MVAPAPIEVLVPHENSDRVSAQIRYHGPLIAPVEKGAEVASLDVMVDDERVQSTPLVAGTAVSTGSFTDRALGAAKELAFGWVRAF
ncbi:hypothetical protein LH400_06680 [Aurantimonas sp. VKM B-3413]|nr:hypothetical protein [Aurantimonas sp. VKM B-3413]